MTAPVPQERAKVAARMDWPSMGCLVGFISGGCFISGGSEAKRRFPNPEEQGAQPACALGPSVATWRLSGQDRARPAPGPPWPALFMSPTFPPGINIQKERFKSTFLL